ncbi:peptidoglycan-binding protein [Gracilibacillus caseinilyticus]|uniref:Peptidoglycan-binding protein n=1 Tax=Gracilibacillus caseinilyticus TaxID=2932256 RepID=A0ABY4EW79_9BACI|nr:peptidoglycan-binding domain-containing protein [Gracilibacillus caseinilyticus]UOQ48123.1 peptidoglycan-binding protein [Gracilibacillus caseinilyticus]
MYFGELTAKAVKTFQRATGIKVDGVPGPVTFGKLFS